MGVTRSACSQWEVRGGTAPRQHRLERLAALLGVTAEWLTTGEVGPSHGSGIGESRGLYRRGLLSDDELTLLEGYAALGKAGRQAILALMAELSSRRRR